MPGFEGLLTGHSLVERYRIEKVIGRGGFAAVYRAVDERLDRTVAVKVITLSASNPAMREEIQKRFHREARAVARMQHPNVVAVYDFGTDPLLGLDFLVMEFMEGEDLSHRLARPEPIPLDTALHIVHGMAQGVGEGHRVGLIHRDMKPGNVFLTDLQRGGLRVCVLDFGIARFTLGDDATQLTRSGGLFLSPAYAAPEQLRGERDLTPAADVFGLGVIGYELLARERPFKGNRLYGSRTAVVEPVPLQQLNPEVPDAVAAVIHRAMSDDPAERFADAGRFSDALTVARAERRVDSPAALIPDPPEAPAPVAVAAAAAPVRPAGEVAAPVAVAPDAGSGPTVRVGPRSRVRGGRWVAAPVLAVLVAAAGWWALAGQEAGDRAAPPDAGVEREVAVATLPESARPQSSDRVPESPASFPGAADSAAPDTTRTDARPTRAELPARPRPEAQPRSGGAPTNTPAPAPRAGSRQVANGGANVTRINREGEQLFARGDFAAATERFRQAVGTAPNSAHFRNNLGWSLFHLKRLDEAARELDEAARLDPKRAIVHANIGEVRRAQGDIAGAIQAYERFLELNTNARRKQIAEEKLRRLRAESAGATL